MITNSVLTTNKREVLEVMNFPNRAPGSTAAGPSQPLGQAVL